MRIRTALFRRPSVPGAILLAACLTACSSMLLPSAAPPTYYQLHYQAEPVPCTQTFGKGLRVWQFTTSTPFNQPDMIVLKSGGEVLFSSGYQWVASPGTLVSESVRHDLSLGNLFPQVVGGSDPSAVPLELTGHVFTFAWVRDGAQSHAALQLEVTLVDGTGLRKVLFHKDYKLESRSFEQDSAAAFADAMSGLVQEFSETLREELCAVASVP